MATGVLQHRRGSTATRLSVTPADGELFVDTDTYMVYIGDGATAGGILIGIGVPSSFTTLTKTTDYTILTADNGIRFNNIGAGAPVILTLPPAAANLQYGGVVFASQYLELLASGSDVINWGGTVSGGGGYVRSNAAGSSITIEAHGSGTWIISASEGSWSVDA